MKRLLTILAILTTLTLLSRSFAQPPTQFTIMSYNVENLFDTQHDEGKQDHEFMPQGNYHWTDKRLQQKLNDLSKVVAAADTRQPCAIIGLCEVENHRVMDMLCRKTPLRTQGYQYVMSDSPDRRGIDVAIMYRPTLFQLISHQSIRAHTPHPTRDILHAAGRTQEGDTLDIYMIHLPSKLGRKQAEMVRGLVIKRLLDHADSIRSQRQQPTIIIMGDFNDELPEKNLRAFSRRGFRDMTARLSPGTYKYRGHWDTLDHILLFTHRPQEQFRGEILTLPFLLEDDPTNGGQQPRRTFHGTGYHGGVSDHLPVLLKVFEKKKTAN